MSRHFTRFIFLLGLLAPMAWSASGQNNVATPYSMFGIGDIDYRDYGRTDGMASTGIGLTSSKYLNNLNPASYSSIELKAFIFEVSAREKTLTYRDNSNSPQTGSDINFEKIAFGFRASRIWTMGAGIKPFSAVDYDVATLKDVIGSYNQFNSSDIGTGGINNLYWVNALNIGKHFSAGVTTSYLFGSLNQTEQLESGITSDTLTVLQTSFLRNIYLQGGLQYIGKLTKHTQLGLGVVYSMKSPLRIDNNTFIEGNNGDTLEGFTNMVGYFEIPQFYGAGFSVTSHDKLTIAGDYKYYNWSSLDDHEANYSLVNSSRYSLGGEYSLFAPNTGDYFEKYVFQAGVYFENSYLKVNNEQLTDYGFTLGTGLPNKNNTMYFNVSVELGRRGTTYNGLIEENYFLFKLNIVIKQPWFIRGKNF